MCVILSCNPAASTGGGSITARGATIQSLGKGVEYFRNIKKIREDVK